MGKEWPFWAGSGGGNVGRREAGSTSSGCMSVVFQLFDFHRQVPSSFDHPSPDFQPEEPPIPIKGIEAPRNSLEMDEPFWQAPSLSPAMKMKDLHIPMGIHIKTRVDTVRSSSTEYISSSSPDLNYSSSPGAKTPTLVARLMGLDLLPDAATSSPSPSSSNRSSNLSKTRLKARDFIKEKHFTGTRSMPETPRVSSERKSDVDRRLSLQSNRENFLDPIGELDFSSIKAKKTREIREIKEGVCRKFGVEITNRVKNRGFDKERGDDNDCVVVLKAKKPSKIGNEFNTNTKKYSMKLLEKEKQNQLILKRELDQKKHHSKKNVMKIKQEEQFVKSNVSKRKCKSTNLSSEFAKMNGVSSSILPVKKEPSFPPTKLPQKQKQSQVSYSISSSKHCKTQLPSCPSLKYKQAVATRKLTTSVTTFTGAETFHYIQDILLLKGIDINTPIPIPLTKLSIMSLQFPPSIFDDLELAHSCSNIRSNRKLMFELVEELLEEIFRPFMGSDYLIDYGIRGPEVMEKLCKKIQSFPLSNCKVLEDIDSLIEGDLRAMELHRLKELEEEGNDIVEETGVELLDKLVQEIAMEMLEV